MIRGSHSNLQDSSFEERAGAKMSVETAKVF